MGIYTINGSEIMATKVVREIGICAGWIELGLQQQSNKGRVFPYHFS